MYANEPSITLGRSAILYDKVIEIFVFRYVYAILEYLLIAITGNNVEVSSPVSEIRRLSSDSMVTTSVFQLFRSRIDITDNLSLEGQRSRIIMS